MRQVRSCIGERDLAVADGIVFTGAGNDIDPRLYGEHRRAVCVEPDIAADRLELAALSGALALDLPVVGICRGSQLLNIASGGSLCPGRSRRRPDQAHPQRCPTPRAH